MKFLPLHIKTALLASAVSFVVLIVGLIAVSANIARQIQEEQKQLAILQAENLAEQLSTTPDIYDENGLQNLMNILSGSRPNLLTVRVWKLENGKFVESVSSDDSLPVAEIGAETQEALQKGVGSTLVNDLPNGTSDSFFRVLSPIVENKRVTGAVEAVERLDTISSITSRYVGNLSWITLATIALMSIAFYLLFQRLVYQPLEKLLAVIESAKSGDFSVEIERANRADEFGRLADNFNSMMTQIREMTAEREKRNEILQLKVREATIELTHKNEQLETANLELFGATRKMREMERLAAAGQTAAEFAHEVGTPLNLISGHVQLLQANVSAKSKEAARLQTITAQIERIEKIVREMLDRTRFGKTQHASCDVNETLKKIFDAVEPTLEENKVKLTTDLSDNLPLVSGDANRLQQVFLNLINNSLDAFSPDGGELRVETAAENGFVKIEFADNGSGMNEETRARVFQPFFTTKQRGHGTGLGLFVVKEILQEHDAEISVSSEIGKGTTFRLLFPAL